MGYWIKFFTSGGNDNAAAAAVMRDSARKRLAAACASVLLVYAGGAWAETDTDLVMLPAPAGAWRTFVGHWESQAELTGASVVVATPTAEYARDSYLGASAGGTAGRREALLLDWSGLWSSWLRIESPQPMDLRPWLGGTLELDVHVADLAKGGVKIKLSCGTGCERAVVLGQARAMEGKGWQHVALALNCFVRDGADFSEVTMPFMLEGSGSGRVSVANLRITRGGKPNTACPDYRTESVTPAMQNQPWAVDWWLPTHQKRLEEARAILTAGHRPEVVFIGDSITQGWGDVGREVWRRHYDKVHAVNLGIGGDRTENVLWRLQHGALDGQAPKVTVLMIGTNNTGQRAENPETTAVGVKRLLDEIRQRLPGTQVLLLAIFPRGEKPGDLLRGINERVNKIIAGYADGRTVHYLDINASLLEGSGTLSRDVMPDYLHPNATGYSIWQREMDPMLQKLLNPVR
jgi:lysophospholipase L1-like esterase